MPLHLPITDLRAAVAGKSIRELDELAAYAKDVASALRDGAVSNHVTALHPSGRAFSFVFPADVYPPALRFTDTLVPLHACDFHASDGHTYQGMSGARPDHVEIAGVRWLYAGSVSQGRVVATFTPEKAARPDEPPPAVTVQRVVINRERL